MGADHQIPAWDNLDGHAAIRGVHVLGATGKRVPVRTTCTAMCHLCGKLNVTAPMTLYGRYESALGRQMFWFGIVRGGLRSYCEGCDASMQDAFARYPLGYMPRLTAGGSR